MRAMDLPRRAEAVVTDGRTGPFEIQVFKPIRNSLQTLRLIKRKLLRIPDRLLRPKLSL